MDNVAALNRIRWRSRRGLLELDLLLQPFLAHGLEALTPQQLAAYCQMLDWADNDFLNCLCGVDHCDNPVQQAIVEIIRNS